MSTPADLAANKAIVHRLVDEVLNGGHLDVIDDLYTPDQAAAAREWITPFRASFPDVHMDAVELLAEGDIVIGRFTCTATHTGTWLGHRPTGRRFVAVDEVNRYRIRDGRIAESWALEDNLDRLSQLGLLPTSPGPDQQITRDATP
ncbi:ester cyclase [Kribbella catacumbae]|uniref:ester cyclase n=1 Tax=Kribbella catacumbae TaxID=460086 RepID=UPI00036EB233|nr:ester cyclase [Kribbella catacumbae]